MLSDLLRMPLRAVSRLLKLGSKALLVLAVAEAVLVGALTIIAALRSKRRGRPSEPFPRGKHPEIELETGNERLKVYCGYPEVFEAMFEELEKAEHTIFIETFTWLEDDVGRRFVDTLARKAREGVEVYASFDALANIGRSASFKEFPELIHTLHFRPFSSPASFLNPYNYVRSHRKVLTVDRRVAFLGGWPSSAGATLEGRTRTAGATRTCGFGASQSTR